MPTLKELKRRRKSVISTQQITRAMKLIAAAKLKRYGSIIEEAREYSQHLNNMVERILSSQYSFKHPYLEQREEGENIALLFLTSDKGLCGGYNANLIKAANKFLTDHKDQQVHAVAVGKKGIEAFKKMSVDVIERIRDWTRIDLDELVSNVSQKIMELYDKGEISHAFIIYSQFVSAFSQKPVVDQILPLTKFTVDEEAKFAREYIFEASEEEVFQFLIPEYMKNSLHIAFLNSLASEFGARMTAMDNATRNAEEMLYSLTLTYNKLRQASITNELIEIVSGVEALKS